MLCVHIFLIFSLFSVWNLIDHFPAFVIVFWSFIFSWCCKGVFVLQSYCGAIGCRVWLSAGTPNSCQVQVLRDGRWLGRGIECLTYLLLIYYWSAKPGNVGGIWQVLGKMSGNWLNERGKHFVSAPDWSAAISTSCFQRPLSWACCHAEFRPRLSGCMLRHWRYQE